jgi:cytochrome c oxidase subunit II
VIPAKTEIQLKISSRDVVHSYWLPRLNGKRDAVPGRTQPMNIEADKPGVYMGQCTEFCGLSHANMRERVIVLSQADFATWAANQLTPAAAPTDAAAVRGAQSFAQRCSSCHQINGSYVDATGKTVQYAPVDASVSLVSGVAPNLTHLMSRGVFAGGTYNLHADGDPTKPLNRPDLEAWLRNPSSRKPMAPNERRGMPNLGLTETQIDDLIAYLSTLK